MNWKWRPTDGRAEARNCTTNEIFKRLYAVAVDVLDFEKSPWGRGGACLESKLVSMLAHPTWLLVVGVALTVGIRFAAFVQCLESFAIFG